jgi:hypothetical protein
MSDEFEQIILADSVSSVAEEPARRRGIFRRRRRGSKPPPLPMTHCENCGAQLTGEFCGQCGQHAIDYRRSILRVLADAADSFLNWDTKFLQTLNLLLFRPWKLTNDFNAGRRARYVHPLRLYLIASIVFFLLARAIDWESQSPIQLTAQDRTELVASLSKMLEPDSTLTAEQRAQVEFARMKLAEAQGALTAEQRAEVRKAFKAYIKSSIRKSLSAEERAKMAAAMARIPKIPDSATETTPPLVPPPLVPPTPAPPEATVSVPPIQVPSPPTVTTPPTSRKEGPFHFTFGKEGEPKTRFQAWLEHQAREKIGEDGAKLKPFLETVRSNIPVMMLCCIPLFAFILKILYIRKRRFYVEHLVYSLHIHTFFYVAIIIISLAVMAANRTLPALAGWITGLMICAILVQIFLSIRRVYRQGWFFTTVKFLFGGLVYFVILVLGVIATTLVTLALPSWL